MTRYAFGPFTVDLENRHVERDGETVALPPKVFDTLAVLVRRGGALVSKDELLREVWPDSFVEESNLTQNIFTLRRALADPEGKSWIETVPRRGYRLTAPAQPVSAGTAVVIEQRQRVRILSEEEIVTESAAATAPRIVTIAAAALLAVAVLGLLAWSVVRSPLDRLDRMEIRRLTTTGNAGDAAISPDGRFVAWVANDGSGASIWLRQIATSGNVRIVDPVADRLTGLTFSPDGERLYYLRGSRARSALHEVSTLGGNSKRILDDVRSPISFSADGSRFAFVRWLPEAGEQQLMIASIAGGEPKRLAARQRPAVMVYAGPAWSPDGRRIAIVVNDSFGGPAAKLIAVSVEDGSEEILADDVGWNAGKVVWLGDDSGIVLVAFEQLWLIPTDGGARRRLTNDAAKYSSVSVSADGQRIVAVQTQQPTVLTISPADLPGTGRTIVTGSGHNNGLAWDDGRLAWLETVAGSSDIWSSRPDGSDRRQLTADPAMDNYPAWCGGGLVFASTRAGGSTIWRMENDGSGVRQISGAGAHYGIDCEPDGRWLAFHRAGAEVSWTVSRMNPDGSGLRDLTSRPATFPAISPDGRWIACNYLPEGGGIDGWTIAVLPAEGGAIRLLPAPGPPTRRLTWSPDGGSILYPLEENGVDNLMRAPVGGAAPGKITRFESGQILALTFSPDGNESAMIRSHRMSDVIVIERFR